MRELAAAVGCSKYPQRWNDIFDTVAEEYKNSGCIYVQPEYYAQLHHKYGILQEHLPLYIQAAEAVGEDEDLTLFLFVMCQALSQREFHEEDIANFSQPNKKDNLAYRMLQALAVASMADISYELLTARGLPQAVIQHVMRMPEGGISYYSNRHDGEPGYDLLDWYQLAIDGKLYRIGRLEYELFASFNGQASVFERQGQKVTLSGVSETDDNWSGQIVKDDGTESGGLCTLSKAEWCCILRPGDPVVGVHIPAGGGLSPEKVDESLQEAKRFISTYFPDYQYKAFTCHSWLMDPQLQMLLDSESNIIKFQKRYSIVPAESSGRGALNFIFYKPDMNFDLATLPESTHLERSIKKHYMDGKRIYELVGYFI